MAAVIYDLGGTFLRGALSDDSGGILAGSLQKKRLDLMQANRPLEFVWQEIISAMLSFEAGVRHQIPPEAPVILSFPGPIQRPSHILRAPTVVGGTTALPDLAAILRRFMGRPVHIINDISAATWYLSRILPAQRFLVVTISSGIGSKIFDRDHPRGVLDDIPYAGEIGHATVDRSPNAMLCDCGGRGHLGAISSGRGMERWARLRARENPEQFATSACVVKFAATPDNLDNEHHLVPAAKRRDPWALQVIQECCYPLAQMLLSVVMAIGIEKVVVIGGFALALGEVYLEILQKSLEDICDFDIMADYLDNLIMMGDAHEEACLEGAAVFAARLGLSLSSHNAEVLNFPDSDEPIRRW